MKTYHKKFLWFIVVFIATVVICAQIISSAMFYYNDIDNHKENSACQTQAY